MHLRLFLLQPSVIMEDNIRDEVFAILRGADLETITSRKVRTIVAERLGIGQHIDQYRSVIEVRLTATCRKLQPMPTEGSVYQCFPEFARAVFSKL